MSVRKKSSGVLVLSLRLTTGIVCSLGAVRRGQLPVVFRVLLELPATGQQRDEDTEGNKYNDDHALDAGLDAETGTATQGITIHIALFVMAFFVLRTVNYIQQGKE